MLAIGAAAAIAACWPASASDMAGDKQTAVAAIEPAILDPLAFQKSKDFAYRLVRPANPNGETIVLLHGSGGDETSLVGLASEIAPRATLLGIRGRVTQEGRTRWYKRLTPVAFDQGDIRTESQAFADFLKRTAEEHRLNLDRTVFLGYSNGANLIAATALLHPGLVHRAALLRPMSVLEQPPLSALTGADMLVVAGKTDLTYAPFAPALEKLLKSCGATVDARTIASDHMLGELDVQAVSQWLAALDRGARTAAAE